MLLNDVFKFGKFKGQTLAKVLASEEGRDYLHWFVEQPCKNPEFADYDKREKESILRKLKQQEGHFDQKDITSTMYLAGEIEKIKERLVVLENRNRSYGPSLIQKTEDEQEEW